MAEKREKAQKAEDKSEDEKEQRQEIKPAPAVKELTRSELEALRQQLQRKFHR